MALTLPRPARAAREPAPRPRPPRRPPHLVTRRTARSAPSFSVSVRQCRWCSLRCSSRVESRRIQSRGERRETQRPRGGLPRCALCSGSVVVIHIWTETETVDSDKAQLVRYTPPLSSVVARVSLAILSLHYASTRRFPRSLSPSTHESRACRCTARGALRTVFPD